MLDADIAKCFDRIDRKALLRKTGTFPTLQRLIKRWLNAGIIDQGVFTETDRGTQQGSVISPLLANIALHGLETHLRSHFPRQRTDKQLGEPRSMSWKPQVIRYADDVVVLHRDKTAIEHCQRLAADWLADIGLELSPTKTRIAHTRHPEEGEAGFNFLGFQVRHYPASKDNTAQGRGFKTLIKPSKDAIKRHYRQLAETISRHKTARQENLIRQLNPIIASWSQYYRAVVSKQVFLTQRGRNHRQQACRRYTCKNCGKRFDDLTETLFMGRHQPLSGWLAYLYLRGLNRSNRPMAEELNLNESDGHAMAAAWRGGIVQRRSQVRMSGVVEGDEGDVVAGHTGRPDQLKGRPPRRRRLQGAPGRGTLEKEKPPIFGMIERGGEVRLVMLENVQQQTLQPLIKEMIEPGTVVNTDEYVIYDALPQWGYVRKSVCRYWFSMIVAITN